MDAAKRRVCGIFTLDDDTPPDDPAHWRKCADEARRAADQVFALRDKDILIDVADAYEQLAKLTEAELASREQLEKST
ncbi:MAG: hypothetical protein WAO08_19810 [Hyphomicrobiaceae bacterium]